MRYLLILSTLVFSGCHTVHDGECYLISDPQFKVLKVTRLLEEGFISEVKAIKLNDAWVKSFADVYTEYHFYDERMDKIDCESLTTIKSGNK